MQRASAPGKTGMPVCNSREELTGRMSTTDSLSVQEWTDINTRLTGATPRVVIEWAVEHFGSRLTMATAFGPEGCVLLHMLSEIEPGVRVFNLDTGYQFPQTLELRDRIKERYGIEVEMIRPDTSVAEYEQSHGGPLYSSNSDRCCYDRKIVPLRRALVGYDAWITAIRADQSSHRASAEWSAGTPSSIL